MQNQDLATEELRTENNALKASLVSVSIANNELATSNVDLRTQLEVLAMEVRALRDGLLRASQLRS